MFVWTSCKDNTDVSSESPVTDTIATTDEIFSVTDIPVVSDTNIRQEISAPVKLSQIPNICSSRYGYYQLNADEKAVYDQLVAAAVRFTPSVDLCRDVTKDQLKKICNIMYIEENDLYYLTDEYEISRNADIVNTVYLTYLYDRQTVERMNAEIDVKLQQILDRVTPDMNDIEKIRTFHDRIIYDCVYSSFGDYAYTPYGALVQGSAVCEGYARAFAMLCNKAGIENVFACGTVSSEDSNGEQHMWNMVKVNGSWYNIDVTADDPNAPEGQDFLGYDYIQYNYFMFPSSQLSSSRDKIEVDTSLYTVPEATSMGANYFVYYGYYAKTYDEGISILTKSIERAAESKKKYVRLRFSNKEAYDQAIQKLFIEKDIFSLEAKYGISKVNLWRSGELLIFQIELIYE